jgi:protein tyrosine phosphatase (PTP) superfamily phosphohydrolase (DUF442 family)
MSAIYNFHKVSDLLACAGQPQESQLTEIADDGYKVVVNLGLSDGKYALADEAASVKNLGLSYYHIPVLFDNPQIEELADFIRVMSDHSHEKILIHCAANYRAVVFTGLYLFAKNQLNEDGLQGLVEEIWQPDAVWQQFIEEGAEYIKENE